MGGLDGIGDDAAGVTTRARTANGPLRMDVILFRRGEIGVVLYVVYMDGECLALRPSRSPPCSTSEPGGSSRRRTEGARPGSAPSRRRRRT